ncbi:hypothetical protein [Streptomyces sirii]|uniref:hypothetical protein n=1 Tax=Streptomyces sirii TaxID=3127701 RepID=UPI003D35AF49
MTSAQSNAPSSAPSSASSGVIHIRRRQTSHFTVLANRLAQRAGSAVTVGVAAYILSLPDGAPITITALCAHFAEGKKAIAEALRELEDEGWLERRIERGPRGRIITRTFAYDVPGTVPEDLPGAVPEAEQAVPEEPAGIQEAEPEPAQDPAAPPHPAPPPLPEAAPEATDLLARLRHRDRRLLLSEREITTLAPAVTEWLDRGAPAQEITAALTDGLPARFSRRPARLLAHRLAALRPPARTAPPPQPDRPPVTPSRTATAATAPSGPITLGAAVTAAPPHRRCGVPRDTNRATGAVRIPGALPALCSAVAVLAPAKLPELVGEMQQALDQAGRDNSTAPIQMFCRRWATFVAIERDGPHTDQHQTPSAAKAVA